MSPAPRPHAPLLGLVGALALLALLAALAAAGGARAQSAAAAGLENPALLRSHDPIRIDSDADLDAAHGVIGGNGSFDNPYVIANWRINFTGVHIRVANLTSSALVIRNVELDGQCEPVNASACPLEAGIYIQEAPFVVVLHSTIRDMDRAAIFVDEHSDYALVEGNDVEGGGNFTAGTGILVKNSTAVVVADNRVVGVGPGSSDLATAAVRVFGTIYTTIADNWISNATEVGLSLLGAHAAHVVDNDLTANRVAMSAQAGDGIVEYNNITASKYYGVIITSPWIRLEHNEIADNLRGIQLTGGANATITLNNIERNPETALDVTQQAYADAKKNWWNSADGPGGVGTGHGDRITVTEASPNQLSYQPFLQTRVAQAGAHVARPDSPIVSGSGGAGTSNPNAPVVRLEGPGVAYLNTTVEFSAAASYDPHGGLLKFAWDLGDGAQAGGLRVRHAYAASGDYAVAVTVQDDQGLVSRASLQVHVTRAPLSVLLQLSNGTAYRGHPVAMIAIVGGQPLGPPMFRWSLGGNGTFEGDPVPFNATIVNYTRPGDVIVGVEVRAGNETVTAFDHVTVLNHKPVAKAGVAPEEGTTQTAFAFDAGNSSDADGDALSYTWDWGGGATSTGAQATHRFPTQGTQVVVLTASDGFDAATTQVVLNVTQATGGQEPPKGAPGPGLPAALGTLVLAAAAGARRRRGA